MNGRSGGSSGSGGRVVEDIVTYVHKKVRIVMDMREIKFRGKRIDTGEWVYGYLTKSRPSPKSTEPPYELQTAIDHEEKGVMMTSLIDPESVGMYSGFYDKNGKEIYESDVIRLIDEDRNTIKVVCEFGTAKREIYGNLVEIHGFYFRRLYDDKKTFPLIKNYAGKHDTELFEIMGNLKDNPEILTGKFA